MRLSLIVGLALAGIAVAQSPTVLQPTDTLVGSRDVINTNFSNLYTGKANLIDCSGTPNSFVVTLGGGGGSSICALAGSAGITALTGDVTASGPGSAAATVNKVHGVVYGASPSTNTVPVVTGSNVVTYEAVPNAALANSSITANGVTCTLGGTCTLPGTSQWTTSGSNIYYTLGAVGIGTPSPSKTLNIAFPAAGFPGSFGVPPSAWQTALFQFGDAIVSQGSGVGNSALPTTYAGPFAADGLTVTLTVPSATTGSTASGANALSAYCRSRSNSLGCVGVNGYGFASGITNGAYAWGANFASIAEPGALNSIMYGLEINLDAFAAQGQAAGLFIDGISPQPSGPARAVWLSALDVSQNPTTEWKDGIFADDGCCAEHVLGLVSDFRVANSRSQPLVFKSRATSVNYTPYIDGNGSQLFIHNASLDSAVGYSSGGTPGIVSCSVPSAGATITVKGGLIVALTGC